MKRFTAIFSALLLTLSACVDTPPPATEILTLQGDYNFRAWDKSCTERWRFGDDGTLTIFSDEEVTTQSFRIEQREKYNDTDKRTISETWLITSNFVSNGKRDCLGHSNVVYPPERDTAIYRAKAGDIVLCWDRGNFLECFGELWPRGRR